MKTFGVDIIGTHLEVSLDAEDDCDILFEKIHGRLLHFEKKFSRFLPDNWLHDLNLQRKAFLDDDGENMLVFMLELAQKTNGYFDPTIGKRLTELGYGKKEELFQYDNYTPLGYKNIEIIDKSILLHGDILLEFGGVGKGYLIDILDAMITEHFSPERNISRYLINFGGDLYGKGGWKVGLESPFLTDEILGFLSLDDTFLACSAPTRRKWGNHHHLIDPHTGNPAREVIASYVEGDSGMITDAYATTLCVMPWTLARETLEKTPEITGVIVHADGNFYQKKGSRSTLFS